MTYCAECGSSIQLDDSFCGDCGQVIRKESTSDLHEIASGEAIDITNTSSDQSADSRNLTPVRVRVLSLLLGGSVIFSIIFFLLYSHNSSLTYTQTKIAGDALMHSQRIGKAVPHAVQGNLEAFNQLEESRNEINNDLRILVKGGEYLGGDIFAANSTMQGTLTETQKLWKNSDKAANTILKLKKELTGFGSILQKLNTLSPVLLELTEQISTLKVQGDTSPREISAAGQLVMLTQRLGRSANEFLTSEGVNPETALLLGKDTNTFRDITEGFLNGSDVLRLSATMDQNTREKLLELQKVFAEYQQLVASILGNLQNITAAKQSERLIFTENEPLNQSLTELQKNYRVEHDSLNWSFWGMISCAIAAVFFAIGIAAGGGQIPAKKMPNFEPNLNQEKISDAPATSTKFKKRNTILAVIIFSIFTLYLAYKYLPATHQENALNGNPIISDPLMQDPIYRNTRNIVSRMSNNGPCVTLADIMMHYAQATDLPDHVREAGVNKAFEKAQHYCL